MEYYTIWGFGYKPIPLNKVRAYLTFPTKVEHTNEYHSDGTMLVHPDAAAEFLSLLNGKRPTNVILYPAGIMTKVEDPDGIFKNRVLLPGDIISAIPQKR
jgi:hypothetical protein